MKLSVTVPDNISVSLTGRTLSVRGPKGTVERQLKDISISVDGKTVALEVTSDRRKQKAVLYAWQAHLKNMFIGVTKGWEARMKIIYLHFPIRFSVEGKNILIGNFLGERTPRITSVIDGVTVKLDKDLITVTGVDKEAVGNQCGNIESTAVIRNRDRRVFSDGIWVIQPAQPVGGNN